MNRAITAAAIAATALTAGGCTDPAKLCLPKGEQGTVLRKGDDHGTRYATIRRDSGEEVTCTGDQTIMAIQPGDRVDGWTLTRADAGRKN